MLLLVKETHSQLGFQRRNELELLRLLLLLGHRNLVGRIAFLNVLLLELAVRLLHTFHLRQLQ